MMRLPSFLRYLVKKRNCPKGMLTINTQSGHSMVTMSIYTITHSTRCPGSTRCMILRPRYPQADPPNAKVQRISITCSMFFTCHLCRSRESQPGFSGPLPVDTASSSSLGSLASLQQLFMIYWNEGKYNSSFRAVLSQSGNFTGPAALPFR
jgi:hypothetical protein